MKKVTLCIHNSLMALSIARSLQRAGGFDVSCVRAVKECAQRNADVVLMEAAYNAGATLEDCLQEANHLRNYQSMCKVIVLCDENSAPEIARQVTQAKKDGRIDDFVYSSVSESYLTAMLLAI